MAIISLNVSWELNIHKSGITEPFFITTDRVAFTYRQGTYLVCLSSVTICFTLNIKVYCETNFPGSFTNVSKIVCRRVQKYCCRELLTPQFYCDVKYFLHESGRTS